MFKPRPVLPNREHTGITARLACPLQPRDHNESPRGRPSRRGENNWRVIMTTTARARLRAARSGCPARLRWIKVDRPRAIDRYIDFFGEALRSDARRSPYVHPRNLELLRAAAGAR
jgi:hypothetical protein